MRVVVIGAGVIGAGVAFRIAEAGADVTLIDANRIGGGTSGCSFAWINSNNKNPKAYYELIRSGMRAHSALAEEFGKAPWLHISGCFQWYHTEDAIAEQKSRIERMKSWGYNIDYVTRAELGELEPDLDLAIVGDASITFAPDEGWLDPVLYAGVMIRAALNNGAVVRTASRVMEIIVRNGVAAGVRTEDGAVFDADVVVNCAGRWSDRVGQEPSFHLPLAPTVGYLAFTPPVGTSISRPLLTPDIDVRPDGAGRLMLRNNAVDLTSTLDMNPTATSSQSLDLMRRATQLVPGLKGVMPEAARVTARAIPKDGLSAVGPLPQLNNYYFAVTHSGVTLSAFLANAVADEVVHGRTHDELDQFRPGRFFA